MYFKKKSNFLFFTSSFEGIVVHKSVDTTHILVEHTHPLDSRERERGREREYRSLLLIKQNRY